MKRIHPQNNRESDGILLSWSSSNLAHATCMHVHTQTWNVIVRVLVLFIIIMYACVILNIKRV